MYKAIVVGGGSLGEAFCIETARRATALNVPLEIVIVDYDTVEERNVASQGFTPSDIGKLKCEVIAEKLSHYPMLTVSALPEKVTEENIYDIIQAEPSTVIIDSVDNYASRRLLWQSSLVTKNPVLHLSMSTEGDGYVAWNYGTEVDTFPLSPVQLSKEKQENLCQRVEDKLPPCQLNSFRSLIFNTSFCGVNAFFMSLGLDNTKTFVDDEGNDNIMKGMFTYWRTQPNKYWLVPELTKIAEWGL